MINENGMVIGAIPYSDPPKPECFVCEWCKHNVPDDENVYHYKSIGQECWICADCLKDDVINMSPDELADALLIDVGKAGDER